MCNNVIKLIDETTDISSLKITNMDWDVIIDESPYQVGRIKGYVHSFKGDSPNDFWCWPRYVVPKTYRIFTPYDGNSGANWGIILDNERHFSHHYGEAFVEETRVVTITRNGENFYYCDSLDDALYKIRRCKDHPLNLDSIDYDEKMIGRKVWFRGEPGVIEDWICGQACVIIKPDGIKYFKCPPEFLKSHLEFWIENNESNYYENNEAKVNIFSDHVWWFRD